MKISSIFNIVNNVILLKIVSFNFQKNTDSIADYTDSLFHFNFYNMHDRMDQKNLVGIRIKRTIYG